MNHLNLFLGKKHILKDITFSLPINGEIIGIVGPNGAGKSSLLKAFIGEFKATGKHTLYITLYINNLDILHISHKNTY